jgi:hypothetical protein
MFWLQSRNRMCSAPSPKAVLCDCASQFKLATAPLRIRNLFAELPVTYLWHVDPLLGNHGEINYYTRAVASWRTPTMSSVSVLMFLPLATPPQLTHCSSCLAYNISALTAQKTTFLYCCIQLLLCRHASLPSRYLVTVVLFLLISRSLPSNGIYIPHHEIKN